MLQFLCVFALSAPMLMPAIIDGKWVAEMAVRRKTETKKVPVRMEFKSDGGKLSGTINARRKGMGTEIQNGKIDGDKFSFEALQKTQKGEFRMRWSGAVSADELKGERAREGAKRSIPFTAKRP